LKLLALPREAREVSEFNGLEKGLGGEHAIEVHSVSVATPKPSPILLPAFGGHKKAHAQPFGARRPRFRAA
jgi:hypothetical protein